MRADVGSESSAAGGRRSEMSEWPRSKFPASAVRQRRNFGHRNRIIGPYGSATRGEMGGRPQGSPLRKRYKGCVGEGLCPSRGRGNRRSAAGGGCSEPVSRKCLDWRTRRWAREPRPYGALHGVRWVVGVKKLGGFLVIFNHLKILLLFCNFCVAFLIDLCYTKLR